MAASPGFAGWRISLPSPSQRARATRAPAHRRKKSSATTSEPRHTERCRRRRRIYAPPSSSGDGHDWRTSHSPRRCRRTNRRRCRPQTSGRQCSSRRSTWTTSVPRSAHTSRQNPARYRRRRAQRQRRSVRSCSRGSRLPPFLLHHHLHLHHLHHLSRSRAVIPRLRRKFRRAGLLSRPRAEVSLWAPPGHRNMLGSRNTPTSLGFRTHS